MSADDRVRMSEEMAGFWAQVKDLLPRLFQRGGFVSAHPMGDPDEVEIFTVWWSLREEHIAALCLPVAWHGDGDEPAFHLTVDRPGTDGRILRRVTAKQVADAIVEAAADQVRKHLPGVQGTGPDFMWGRENIASFDDAACEAQNLGAFVEYAQRRADRALHREATQAVINLLMREDVPFTMTSYPLYGLGVITLVDRKIRIDTDNGRTVVTSTDLDEEPRRSVEITMGSRGVEYPLRAMEALIRGAAGRAR